MNKDFRKKIDDLLNERVIDIILDGTSLQLKISETINYSIDFNNKRILIKFNLKFYNLLKNLINKRKKDLILLANLYQEKNRDFLTFLYDLIVLVYFVNELPDEFQRLLEKDELQSEGDLMHNRILVQTAFNLKNKHIIKLNKKSKKKPSPDLTVDNFIVDIKTIVGRYNWTTEDVSRLVRAIDEKYSKAMNQTTNGIVFISFWSKNMNNLFREYFYGQYTRLPYKLENNSCYFILNGFDALQDYYTTKYVYDLKNNLTNCNLIQNYTPVNFPTHFKSVPVGRNNFPISRSSPSSECGISFSYG